MMEEAEAELVEEGGVAEWVEDGGGGGSGGGWGGGGGVVEADCG